MELVSTQDVTREFIKVFLEGTTLKTLAGEQVPFHVLTKGAGTIDVLVRYFNRGGATGVTELPEYYPVIVIQDFPPELNKSLVRVKDWVEGAVDIETGKVEKLNFPIPMTFRYQVSIVTSKKTDSDVITDLMYKKFGAGALNECFLFNKVNFVEHGDVGLPVPYSSMVKQINREDGRTEWAVDYTLKTFVHLRPVEWVDYIEQIQLIVENRDTEERKSQYTINLKF